MEERLPHCSACFKVFDGKQGILTPLCYHVMCQSCAEKWGKCMIAGCDHAGILEHLPKLETALATFRSSEDSDKSRLLQEVYEIINVNSVRCRFVKEGKACSNLSECRYDHCAEEPQLKLSCQMCQNCGVRVDINVALCPFCLEPAKNPQADYLIIDDKEDQEEEQVALGKPQIRGVLMRLSHAWAYIKQFFARLFSDHSMTFLR